MHSIRFFILALWLSTNAQANPAQTYLDKFLTYTKWCQQLPNHPDPAFLAFIEQPTPLTRKLREKWLYQLAYNKDWVTFIQYYRGSNDTALQCYAQTALYNQGRHQEVLFAAKAIWLTEKSLPKACDDLFNTLIKNKEMKDSWIQQRLELVLDTDNIPLAQYLLKQFATPRNEDAERLAAIHHKPMTILTLKPGFLQGELYLYGLKKLVQKDMEKAILLANTTQANTLMTEAEKQRFLAYVALFKAMRNESDALLWFAKVKPAFYNDVLLEWEIRFALIHHQWRRVVYLISKSRNKREPVCQYWMARALTALGERETANELYQQLATKRHYYGFLASLRLHKNPSFENEPTTNNTDRLQPYRVVTDKIKSLYDSHDITEASRLLNDFISELPKDDQSALVYWITNDLQWHDKAIYLSSNDTLNNQLSLRFPLAHHQVVKENATRYHIPQAFIYAIIRQESTFRDTIVSSAGANGLMQLMPATARLVAHRARIPYTDQKQLFSSQTNIHIGTAYLEQLAQQFRHHPILMAAAYNAGPKQVNYWLKNHDPKEMDIWIETLPWRETRNYLKNIFAFYAVYQYRMQTKPDLTAFMQPF